MSADPFDVFPGPLPPRRGVHARSREEIAASLTDIMERTGWHPSCVPFWVAWAMTHPDYAGDYGSGVHLLVRLPGFHAWREVTDPRAAACWAAGLTPAEAAVTDLSDEALAALAALRGHRSPQSP